METVKIFSASAKRMNAPNERPNLRAVFRPSRFNAGVSLIEVVSIVLPLVICEGAW